jgi:hypothetical protein
MDVSLLYFMVPGKLLVTTGHPSADAVKSEVIDLEDPSNICQPLEDFPIELTASTGGLLNRYVSIATLLT